jgi:hypothetical protein
MTDSDSAIGFAAQRRATCNPVAYLSVSTPRQRCSGAGTSVTDPSPTEEACAQAEGSPCTGLRQQGAAVTPLRILK